MDKLQLNHIDQSFFDRLLNNLDAISESNTSVEPAKHIFNMLMESVPFKENPTTLNPKFETILTKYHTNYPQEFESYVTSYNKMKNNFELSINKTT